MPELDDDQKYAVERIEKAFSARVNKGFILAVADVIVFVMALRYLVTGNL